MNRRNNRFRLVRPSDAFMPAGLLIASLLGYCTSASLFYAGFLGITLLSLGSCTGVRTAFATQPAIRAVRGSVKSAILLQIGAFALAGVAFLLIKSGWKKTLMPFIAAGFLYNIEHTFYEYLFALGDRRSATLCQGLSTLLLVTGLCLTGSGPDSQPAWLMGTALLSALAALAVSLVMGDGIDGRPNARVLTCAPMATLQSLLYPLALGGLGLILHRSGAVPAFFCGLALYELCRTPFRRSQSEASPMNRVLLLACAASLAVAIAALLLHAGPWPLESQANPYFNPVFDIPFCCAAVILASICAFALFGNLRRRERELP